MSFTCNDCPKRPKCKEICKRIEKRLPNDYTGKLRSEFPTDKIDLVAEYGRKRERGRRKRPLISPDANDID